MIVNYTSTGWEIVTQRAHGLLAAELAARWRNDIRTARWTETLLAIAEHDDAQTEMGRDGLLTSAGGPRDFKMRSFDLGHCVRTFTSSLSKSRYIALLCSMHLEFVFGKACADSSKGTAFMQEQSKLRKRWLRELGISKVQAERDYALLEWCDALSLLICQRENQPEARAVEISSGPENRQYLLTEPASGQLNVDPWPFQENSFEISFEVRKIPRIEFKNDEEFRSDFMAAEIYTKRWLFTEK
jgi:hypothetical protein